MVPGWLTSDSRAHRRDDKQAVGPGRNCVMEVPRLSDTAARAAGPEVPLVAADTELFEHVGDGVTTDGVTTFTQVLEFQWSTDGFAHTPEDVHQFIRGGGIVEPTTAAAPHQSLRVFRACPNSASKGARSRRKAQP